MSGWTCPECGGGFPEPEMRYINDEHGEKECCPWCGQVRDWYGYGDEE